MTVGSFFTSLVHIRVFIVQKTKKMSMLSSLRAQLCIPMLLGSLLAAAVVAISAYWIAESRAKAEVRERLHSIANVISETNFPLTQNVMQMLAGLTDAYWININDDKQVFEFASPKPVVATTDSRPLSRRDLEKAQISNGTPDDLCVQIGDRTYIAVLLKGQGHRMAIAGDHRYHLLVMLDASRQKRAVVQAALPPLLTGLATIVLLGSLSLLLAERLVKRIAGLQREVERIAAGNFEIPLDDSSNDEIDRLADALCGMSERLDQMWEALRRNHTQQLINQIASGLAHNLRNTLTGARLAVELIAQKPLSQKLGAEIQNGWKAPPEPNPAFEVAINQIKIAEQYIQRLLWMAKGREADQPKSVPILECLQQVKTGLASTAAHRSVAIHWNFDPLLDEIWLGNEAALMSALSNLVWNAIEAAKHVWVEARWSRGDPVHGREERCQIEIIDNGPGPPREIQQTLFEPFVSAKAEGIGLGLPLVRQAADALHGSVDWFRRDNRTVFLFEFPVMQVVTNSLP